ncbi:hypothetical protein CC86DRAFT_191042 [Ophiobolus disseminans]|uniref:Uncharacterized protein n=1 Tax=Ophiobolus disseminans TaxID=1469910 RepID=A0A6A7A8P2_9PLEO|nr:hypothetical protein CC86DRAFT_191042 [Ophiobolus disseminans]
MSLQLPLSLPFNSFLTIITCPSRISFKAQRRGSLGLGAHKIDHGGLTRPHAIPRGVVGIYSVWRVAVLSLYSQLPADRYYPQKLPKAKGELAATIEFRTRSLQKKISRHFFFRARAVNAKRPKPPATSNRRSLDRTNSWRTFCPRTDVFTCKLPNRFTLDDVMEVWEIMYFI